MAAISPQTVKQMARLGRVALSPAEMADATAKLNQILGHFATIQEIGTARVPASDDVTGLKNIARPDRVESETLCAASALLAAAPAMEKNQIKVKSVF